MRFNVEGNRNTISMESNSQIDSILDISRGGIAVKHNNQLKVGDVVPVQISYGDLDINANVKVVTATDARAGAMFVDLDRATANKLLYMNILLEDAAANGIITMKQLLIQRKTNQFDWSFFFCLNHASA